MKFTNKILLTGTLLAATGAFAIQTSGAASTGQANQVPTSPSSPSMQSPSSPPSPSNQTPGVPPSAQPGTPGSTAPGSTQGSAPSAQPEQAPPPQPGRPSIDDQVKMLSQELNLTSDQQGKLKNILEDQHQQAMTFVNDSSISREDKVQKIRVLRESTITKARGIMNDDQKKKLDAMLQQQQGGPHPGNPPSSSSPSSTTPSSTTPPK